MRSLLLLAVAALACGKQTFLAAAFVQTPALPNPANPQETLPQFQVLTAYFGTIDTTNPTKIDASKEAPITDAAATVSFRTRAGEDRLLTLQPQSTTPGTYALSSKDDPNLDYEVGVPYTLILQTAGNDSEAYGARFVPAPAGDIAEFAATTCTVSVAGLGSSSAPRCIDNHAANSPMTLTRTDVPAAGQDPLPAFVLVGRIDPNNPSAEPTVTFKTVPDSADKLLKFVLSDHDYRKTSFTVDGSAFPSSGYYIVSLLVAKQGKVSGNAFLGSTALAATGSAGIVHVP